MKVWGLQVGCVLGVGWDGVGVGVIKRYWLKHKSRQKYGYNRSSWAHQQAFGGN